MSQTQEVTSLQLKGEIKVVSVVWGDKMHLNQMHSLFIYLFLEIQERRILLEESYYNNLAANY